MSLKAMPMSTSTGATKKMASSAVAGPRKRSRSIRRLTTSLLRNVMAAPFSLRAQHRRAGNDNVRRPRGPAVL